MRANDEESTNSIVGTTNTGIQAVKSNILRDPDPHDRDVPEAVVSIHLLRHMYLRRKRAVTSASHGIYSTRTESFGRDNIDVQGQDRCMACLSNIRKFVGFGFNNDSSNSPSEPLKSYIYIDR